MRFLFLLPLLCSAQDPVAVFGTTVVIPSGLKGDVYHVSPGMRSLAELSDLQPQVTIYSSYLKVPPQHFTFGFPGVTDRFEWFAIDYTGKFWIENPGLYRFRLTSDDGAMLYIDEQLIADNDGIHSTTVRLASLRLSGGMHTIRVPYFQGPRETVALILEVAGPGEQPRVFSTNELKPPADPETWRFPSQVISSSADPDLGRGIPERLGGPENGRQPRVPGKAKKRR
ncbi:MAG: hypothetical protein JWN34_5359 [Bryobacterales bacterium]|nr:hypothetical protein [Bryobacterales bacterium]